MERIKKNDPVAMCQMGKHNHAKGNFQVALEYYTKAAEVNEADAHYCLSLMYHNGDGVEKDEKKAIYHMEEAAIAGHPSARHNLGCIEASKRRFERAKKHLIINANLGNEGSLKMLRTLYADGHASKEDYADALRAYQAALNAMKSPEREEAEEAKKRGDIAFFGGP
jgi:TPR repeat protein